MGCRWATFNPLRALIEQNGVGRAESLSLLELEHSSPARRHLGSWFSGILTWTGAYIVGSPGSQALQFGLELHHWLSWASDLQMADPET